MSADVHRESVRSHPSPAIRPARPRRARLKVEQASYAYSATDRSAPKFTLGPVSFEAHHARDRRDSWTERQRQIDAAEACWPA